MNNKNTEIINEYVDYLIRLKISTKDIYDNISNIENLKEYEKLAKLELKKLEKLSEEYKLYDSNYESFMLAMGKLAIGVKKLDEFDISLDFKNNIKEKFSDYNLIFEELQRKNIMKDAYVWK